MNPDKPQPGFRGDIVNNNNDILAQYETLAPNYNVPDTKFKSHIIIINSIDRNWYSYQNETPYNYLVKLGGSAKDQYSTVSHDYKNVVSFSIDKIILSNRPCMQYYNSNIAPRLNDNPYLTIFFRFGSVANIGLTIIAYDFKFFSFFKVSLIVLRNSDADS